MYSSSSSGKRTEQAGELVLDLAVEGGAALAEVLRPQLLDLEHLPLLEQVALVGQHDGLQPEQVELVLLDAGHDLLVLGGEAAERTS